MSPNTELREVLFVEDYAPTTMDQLILPERYKSVFADYIAAKACPNLLIAGPKGIGKTTTINVLVNAMGATMLKVNASMEGIDVIRNKVRDFASAANGIEVIFDESPEEALITKRVVLFDEFDGMSRAGQDALRGFIEEFQHNCIFMFTCNFKEKIIEAIWSRCKCFDFKISKTESGKIAGQFMNSACAILESCGITYDRAVVATVIKQKFPDFRAALNELQGFSMSGTLSNSVMDDILTGDIHELAELIKNGNWDNMRTWITKNGNIDESNIMVAMVQQDFLNRHVTKASQPDMLCFTEEYLSKLGTARDPQITLAALCTVLMKNVKWIKGA